jgi:hypothetical protein
MIGRRETPPGPEEGLRQFSLMAREGMALRFLLPYPWPKCARWRDPMTTVITLIHGTWAPYAPWTDADSPISRALESCDLEDPVIVRFVWSGRNRHLARLRAAEALRGHINECEQRFPGCRQILIAHSHGGNVVMYALRDEQVRQRISGVVCLSTPFFVVRPRNLGSSGLFPLAAFIVGTLGLLAGFVGDLVAPGITDSRGRWLLGMALTSIPLLLLVRTTLFLFKRMVPGYADAPGETFLGKVISSFQYPDLREEDLLILRASGDEASSTLSALQLMAAGVTAIWRIVARLFTSAEKLSDAGKRLGEWHGRRILARITLVLGAVSVALWIHSCAIDHLSKAEEGASILAVGLACGGLLLLLVVPRMMESVSASIQFAVSICLAPIGAVVAILHLPFGIEATIFGLALEITAETTPPGQWHVLQMRDDTTHGLAHSSTYATSEAIHSISTWISTR